MPHTRYLQYRFQYLILGLVLAYALFTTAQSDESSSDFDLDESITILNEEERLSYQKDRAQLIKDELSFALLEGEHRDLLAEALSKFHGGVPVCTYREDSVESLPKEEDLIESTKVVSIQDSGFATADESRPVPLHGFMTPFDRIFLKSWNLPTGRVLTQSDSKITFRFDLDPETSDDIEERFREHHEAVTSFIRGKKLVVDITIDKQDRTVKRYRSRLLRSFGKLFRYRVKKFNTTFDYEFKEACQCMVAVRHSMEISFSSIVTGRLGIESELKYSEMQFEKPLRYVLEKRYSDRL